MPVSTDPEQHARQTERLTAIVTDSPQSLAGVLLALSTCLALATSETR